MTTRYRRLAILAAAAPLLAWAGPGVAASKKNVQDSCAEAIKKEFGASPVEFGNFRRDGSRNMAFGELTMSDGTKAQIRCKYKTGKVLNLQFRGTNEPGNMWVDQRPAAATFVDPEKDKPEKDADAKDGTDAKTEADKEPVRPRFKKVPTN